MSSAAAPGHSAAKIYKLNSKGRLVQVILCIGRCQMKPLINEMKRKINLSIQDAVLTRFHLFWLAL